MNQRGILYTCYTSYYKASERDEDSLRGVCVEGVTGATWREDQSVRASIVFVLFCCYVPGRQRLSYIIYIYRQLKVCPYT